MHQLMLRRFSQETPAQWFYFCDGSGSDETKAIESYLKTHFEAEPLLVEVHRSIGGCLSFSEASALIAKHLCRSNIKVANRAFTSFAIFASSGVTTAWQSRAQQNIQADAASPRRLT
ncbi:hypothetical protein [Hydrocarboniphaga daqingensis]|uniref:hypothetical protein n=1 Tax=Hydrocarboniphaga daqingensis TaxID=490188 RepID=UPI001114AB1A|nr:hypothetical protein [Hydrocarboniphaga daqingensis]